MHVTFDIHRKATAAPDYQR